MNKKNENKARLNIELIQRFMDAGEVTAESLAHAADISRTTVYNFLKGKYLPQTHILYAIAEALGVPMEWLIVIPGREEDAYKNYEAAVLGPHTAETVREMLAQFNLLSPAEQRFVIQQMKMRQKNRPVIRAAAHIHTNDNIGEG